MGLSDPHDVIQRSKTTFFKEHHPAERGVAWPSVCLDYILQRDADGRSSFILGRLYHFNIILFEVGPSVCN